MLSNLARIAVRYNNVKSRYSLVANRLTPLRTLVVSKPLRSIGTSTLYKFQLNVRSSKFHNNLITYRSTPYKTNGRLFSTESVSHNQNKQFPSTFEAIEAIMGGAAIGGIVALVTMSAALMTIKDDDSEKPDSPTIKNNEPNYENLYNHYNHITRWYMYLTKHDLNNDVSDKYSSSHLSLKLDVHTKEYNITFDGENLPDGNIIVESRNINEFRLLNVAFKGCSKDGKITGIIKGVRWDWVYPDKPPVQHTIQFLVVDGKIVWTEIHGEMKNGFMTAPIAMIIYDHINSRYINRSWIEDTVIVERNIFDYIKYKLDQHTVMTQRQLDQVEKWDDN